MFDVVVVLIAHVPELVDGDVEGPGDLDYLEGSGLKELGIIWRDGQGLAGLHSGLENRHAMALGRSLMRLVPRRLESSMLLIIQNARMFQYHASPRAIPEECRTELLRGDAQPDRLT